MAIQRPSGLFFRASSTSFHTHTLLLTVCLRLFLYRISFLLFPCASAWENILGCVPISYRHTEWYFFFAKRHDRRGRRVTSQKLTIIIICTERDHRMPDHKSLYMLAIFCIAICLRLIINCQFVCLFVRIYHFNCGLSKCVILSKVNNTLLLQGFRVTLPTAGMYTTDMADVRRIHTKFRHFWLLMYFRVLAQIKMYLTVIIRMCCIRSCTYF